MRTGTHRGKSISIHSLRMEGDDGQFSLETRKPYFNPLPPHGGRLQILACNWEIQFISIHSLRMEGDPWFCRFLCDDRPFQSTPSAWRETRCGILYNPGCEFQSTPSAWRETDFLTLWLRRVRNFNPLPPHGGRQHNCGNTSRGYFISIHSLRMEGDDNY